MSSSDILTAARALPIDERVRIAQELWNDIVESGFEPELTPEEIAELDRRAEDALRHPDRALPVDEVFAKIQERLRR